MKFIAPKYANKEKVEMHLSKQTLTILEYYSKYTGFDRDEIADRFFEQLLEDESFIEWAKKRRSNKKMEAIMTSYFGSKEKENVGL